jgi:Staphylococcal nuclease homologue
MPSFTISLAISIVVLTFPVLTLHFPDIEARCPNGFHMSPSGVCEKVNQSSSGLPRCPNGYHRSPDGNCESVLRGGNETSEITKQNSTIMESINEEDGNEQVSNNVLSNNSQNPVTLVTGCKGSADCFRGIVTEIVDGDTLDVNNVRIRLSMVNTPERGDQGYSEATDVTKSKCPVGSEALVDEDDGQKGGSFGRLIGVVYCNGTSTSLNEILLATGKAALYEDFCNVSEFANEDWVTRYGC